MANIRLKSNPTRKRSKVEEMAIIINDLSVRVGFLERTAPGRGNTYLGNGLVLTRLSLGEMFYGDPIFVLSSNDLSITPRFLMDGIYERDSTYYVCNRVRGSSLCIDVGANFGYYSVVMARHADKARIIALEPGTKAFSLLEVNAKINYISDRCTLINKCASDTAGLVNFYVDEALLGDAHVVDISSDCSELEKPMECVSIDGILKDEKRLCDFVKIDVEGYEPQVISGMINTIERNPNISILMEWSNAHLVRANNSPLGFYKELRAIGFHFYQISVGGQLKTISQRELLNGNLLNIVIQKF